MAMSNKFLTHTKPSSAQDGFTLLEVMIALLIFSIGLLGLAGMQVHGIQNTHKALNRSIAIQQAYDMSERIRANRAGIAAGDYDDLSISTVGCAQDQDCSSIPHKDFQDWYNSNASMLPSGQGTVKGENGVITVTVHWNERPDKAVTGTNCPPESDNDLACYQLTVIP